MVMKNDGRSSNKDKKKRHKIIKCSQCGNKIDIDERIELEDFDRINENQISVFCEICDNYEIVKL